MVAPCAKTAPKPQKFNTGLDYLYTAGIVTKKTRIMEQIIPRNSFKLLITASFNYTNFKLVGINQFRQITYSKRNLISDVNCECDIA